MRWQRIYDNSVPMIAVWNLTKSVSVENTNGGDGGGGGDVGWTGDHDGRSANWAVR